MNIDGMKFVGFYGTVARHLTKAKGWSPRKTRQWLLSKPFVVVLRVANHLTRRKLLSLPAEFRRERVDSAGRIWVSDRRGSSEVSQ